MTTRAIEPALASRSQEWQRFGHLVAAVGLTLLLLVFLAFARWLSSNAETDQVIRLVDSAPPVALPAPPPPPTSSDDAPRSDPLPPLKVELPQLDLQIEEIAPPLAARLAPKIELAMTTAVFDVEVDPVAPSARPRTSSAKTSVGRVAPTSSGPISKPVAKPAPTMRSSYDAGDLDAKPRLVNRPTAIYPRDQLRAGVKEGRVVLEVSISTSGRVTVRRVISSSHADFTAMARKFAAKARFSVPKKNGRAVTAIYRWPLVLRP